VLVANVSITLLLAHGCSVGVTVFWGLSAWEADVYVSSLRPYLRCRVDASYFKGGRFRSIAEACWGGNGRIISQLSRCCRFLKITLPFVVLKIIEPVDDRC
jgi:hypothetical protein